MVPSIIYIHCDDDNTLDESLYYYDLTSNNENNFMHHHHHYDNVEKFRTTDNDENDDENSPTIPKSSFRQRRLEEVDDEDDYYDDGDDDNDDESCNRPVLSLIWNTATHLPVGTNATSTTTSTTTCRDGERSKYSKYFTMKRAYILRLRTASPTVIHNKKTCETFNGTSQQRKGKIYPIFIKERLGKNVRIRQNPKKI